MENTLGGYMSGEIGSLNAFEQKWSCINAPFVDMRDKPDEASKVASQAIFAEKVQVKMSQPGWSLIETPDRYMGWVESKSVVQLNGMKGTPLKVTRLSAHIYGVKDTEYGPIHRGVPFGAAIDALDREDPRWVKIALPDARVGYIQKGDVAIGKELQYKGDLVDFSLKFLNLPYTWGGRSSFGYDCSGFVQMLYNQIGVSLERDSKDQVLDKRFRTLPVEQVEPGDLIFFGREEGKVSHVGMYHNKGEFIHSTVKENQPWIRLSSIHAPDWAGGNTTTLSYRVVRQLI